MSILRNNMQNMKSMATTLQDKIMNVKHALQGAIVAGTNENASGLGKRDATDFLIWEALGVDFDFPSGPHRFSTTLLQIQ